MQSPRGSNPLLQTKRGKLQQRRNTLNEQISKQLRLRTGAENLLRATNDKKLREQIALELSFLDSNLQLLGEQLAELNTSVQIYQNEKCPRSMPLIPFGLRETKDIEFNVSFKEFIAEHYFEDPVKYDQSVKGFTELRKAIKTPSRNDDGIKLLFEYYNHLCCVERRFFASGRRPGVYFEWFDSLTGIPAMQRSIAFEKGSILFNIGALYSQLAASEDRSTASGLEKAIEYFSRAAGVLHFLKENFSNSPSIDMRRDIVDVFLSLLLAHAQECFFDLCLFHMDANKASSNGTLKLSEEAAQVSKLYREAWSTMASETLKQHLPVAWVALVLVKRDYYSAMAHYFNAVSLTNSEGSLTVDKAIMVTSGPLDGPASQGGQCAGQTTAERALLSRAHLKCAFSMHEEASNSARMCKQLRQLSSLQNVLKKSHERMKKLQQEIDGGTGGLGTADELETCDLYENVENTSQSIFDPTLIPPDFSLCKVMDFFRDLGPLSIFCARNSWTLPRTCHLRRSSRYPGYGFSVRGDAPVFISSVEPGGLANLCGMKIGDIIIEIENEDMKWASQQDVVRQIRSAGDSLILTVSSPCASSPSSSIHSLSGASSASTTCSSSASSPSSASVENGRANGLVLTQNSYSTLPSNFHSRAKASPISSAPITQSQTTNGALSLSRLKKEKEKKKSSGYSSGDSSGSSWSLRNLIFTKKYSKSFDSHLNNPSLYR